MKKNILIFGHSYAHGFIEATNQYIQLFNPAYYDVTIVYLSGEADNQITERHLTNNIIFLNLPLNVKRGLKISVIKKMLALSREKQFQMVICHRYKPTYVMLWVSRFYPIPVLISVMHEMNTFSHFSRKLLIATLASKNALFAGVSNAVRADIRKNLTGIPDDRITTLYNAIDVESTESKLLERNHARHQMQLQEDTFVFGILGRLAKAKDHATLIQAFSLIKPHCQNCKLVIIGEGELEHDLKLQIRELGLEKDILMTGFLPNASFLLKALDVFVLSSIKEAFGRVLIEAMIAKVPVVATQVNGIPEIVKDVGLLTEKQSPQPLADKMLAFYRMSKGDLTQWGEKGYQRIVDVFSTKRFYETFWQLPCIKNISTENTDM